MPGPTIPTERQYHLVCGEGALCYGPRLSCTMVGSMVGTSVQVPAVIFLATLIRSAFGFGEALIAVPLLALVLPVEVAAPVAVLVSITVAAVVVAQDWRDVHMASAGWLVLSTLFGIPLGLLILKSVPEPLVKAVLAVV